MAGDHAIGDVLHVGPELREIRQYFRIAGESRPVDRNLSRRSAELAIPSVTIRNVWSAALSQAKNEVTGWSAQMYSAFVGAQGSWP
jgi:hypothetical protein